MKRIIHTHKFQDLSILKNQLLRWAQQYNEVVWLDSNDYEFQNYPEYNALLAVDAFTSIKTSYTGAFDRLEEYQNSIKDWIFGYLAYDLKNDIELLSSNNEDFLDFPDLQFFQPKKIIFNQG